MSCGGISEVTKKNLGLARDGEVAGKIWHVAENVWDTGKMSDGRFFDNTCQERLEVGEIWWLAGKQCNWQVKLGNLELWIVSRKYVAYYIKYVLIHLTPVIGCHHFSWSSPSSVIKCHHFKKQKLLKTYWELWQVTNDNICKASLPLLCSSIFIIAIDPPPPTSLPKMMMSYMKVP